MADRAVAGKRTSYPTYRIGVKALVRDGRHVLLTKERHTDGQPFWTLPGGGVEPHESMRAALRREVWEELGCAAIPAERLDEFWYRHRSTPGRVSRYHLYRCSLSPMPGEDLGDEILDCAWVRPADLPRTTLAPVKAVIERCTDRWDAIRSSSVVRTPGRPQRTECGDG